jgi:hypothetical protein
MGSTPYGDLPPHQQNKAYDMRIEGKTNVEIGAMFIFEDAQKVLKDADLKNKCNVRAYRLIKKAEANIKAVEGRYVWIRALAVKIFPK